MITRRTQCSSRQRHVQMWE